LFHIIVSSYEHKRYELAYYDILVMIQIDNVVVLNYTHLYTFNFFTWNLQCQHVRR